MNMHACGRFFLGLAFAALLFGCSDKPDKIDWNTKLAEIDSINAPLDANGNRATHLAVQTDDLDALQRFVNQGANLNLTNDKGLTAVDLAVQSKWQDMTDWAHPYLEASALYNKANKAIEAQQSRQLGKIMQGEFYWYPAGQVERHVIKSAGVNIPQTQYKNYALSTQTVRYDCYDCLLVLEKAGYDIARITNLLGATPLHAATYLGRPKFVKNLVNYPALINQPNENGITPLILAVNQHSRIKPADTISITRLLIAHGADVNAQDNDGETALLEAVSPPRPQLIKLLLDAGANACLPSSHDGDTPLMKAAWYADPEAAQLLLAKSDCVNAVNDDDETALHRLADTPNPTDKGAATRIALAQILLSHGADVSRQDRWGATPLHTAAQNGNLALAKLFLERGANTATKSNKGKTPLFFAVDSKTLLGNEGHGPIPHPDMVALLVKKSDLTLRDKYGDTPLHDAAGVEYEDAPDKRTRILRILVEAGVDIDARNKQGWTALYVATKRQHPNAVAILLQLGADKTLADNQGITPLQLAQNDEFEKITDLLMQ